MLKQENSDSPSELEPDISVVIPSYNEGELILGTLETLSGFLNSLNRKYEIIISDDGSNDATPLLNWPKFYAAYHVRYLRNTINTGKGGALKRGLQSSKGKFVFFTDADLPVDLGSLTLALSLLESNNFDIVIGDRRLANSKVIGFAPVQRPIASKVFNIGVQLFMLPGFTDTQCPMKGFSTHAIQGLLPMTCLTSYAFDAELLYLANWYKLRIKRIPVSWKDTRKNVSIKDLIYLTIFWLKDFAHVRFRKKPRTIKSGAMLL